MRLAVCIWVSVLLAFLLSAPFGTHGEVILEMDTYIDSGFPARSFSTNVGDVFYVKIRADALTESNNISKISWSVKAPKDIQYRAATLPNPFVTNALKNANITASNDLFFTLNPQPVENFCWLTNNSRSFSGNSFQNKKGHIALYRFVVPRTNLIGPRTFIVENVHAYDTEGNEVPASGSAITIRVIKNRTSDLTDKPYTIIDLVKLPNEPRCVPRIYAEVITKSNLTLKTSVDLYIWQPIVTNAPYAAFSGYTLPIDYKDTNAPTIGIRFYQARISP